jgi:hypothetical protein
MISIATSRKALLIRLVIALVGLVAILCSVLIPEKIAGLPLQEITRELATFVIASLLVHWIYESHIKHEIFQDVTDYVIKRGNVSRSGIADYCENTKDIDYSDILNKSVSVIIGLHYSPRIIEDNHHCLAQRARHGKETIIIASTPHGNAIDFLKRVRGENDHVDANVKKIYSLIREINKASAKKPVRLLYHDEVLRYSFVLTDEQVWIKLYRNSRGLSNVPGIAVSAGTRLFDFFKADIHNLKESAVNGVEGKAAQ